MNDLQPSQNQKNCTKTNLCNSSCGKQCKPRKKSSLPLIKELTGRVGRTFNDFIKFIENNPNLLVVEMDTVHGTRSGITAQNLKTQKF